MEHSFDIDHASKYGVKEAILIKLLQYWIQKNKANKKHYHDGKTWTYNTCSALTELLPYWTEKQVRTVIQSLKDQKVIVTGNYNNSPYDRTMWYAFQDESKFLYGKSILPNGQIENTGRKNQFSESGEPIPVILPIKEPVKETDNISESAPNGGNNTKPLSGISCNSKGSLEPKKEESSGKEERKLTDAEILFNFWVSNKGLVQHRSLTTTMEKVLKARLSEEGIDRLLESIKNYNTVLTSDVYFYSYPHNLDDFFRNGTIQKVPPYRNFLPESKPFEKFLKHKKFSSGYTQQTQEEPEVDSRVEQERFTEDRALNRLSEAVRKFKSARGEDPKKWVEFFRSARPADRDNAFLRWVWDMAIKGIPFTEEIFNQIHNRIVAESGLTYDTFEQARDEIFKRGFTAPSAQQRA